MSLEVWELSDVKQLDGLFRAHVLLAQVAGRHAPDYTEYVLQAVAYVIQIWQVSCWHVTQKGSGLMLCAVSLQHDRPLACVTCDDHVHVAHSNSTNNE